MSEAIKNTPVNKYNYERFILAWDFTNDFETGESIDSVNSTASAEDKDGNNVTSTILEIATVTSTGNKLLVTCKAGTHASSPYYVAMKCQSNLGYKYQGVITINIVEE